LDLAGIDSELIAEIDVEWAIADRLHGLERYWDASREPPAYSSDVRGSRVGGDRYYDDNAWVGLGLVQLERLRPGSGYLHRAEELFRFAVSGWSRDQEPSPGGVFWVEQGRGTGRTNHDRNTVSNAPNAELGLHVAELAGAEGPTSPGESIGPREMYEWVLGTLDASNGTGASGTGLFWDKVRGDGSIDRAFWTYNQGSMVGLNVLLARSDAAERAAHLRRAEAIARKALQHYAGAYEAQPAAFNAIFFRNLLLLHAASDDSELRGEIVQAIRDYVDRAWTQWRDGRDRFRLPRGGLTLLNQSAMVQLLALLAWDPERYGRLA
jgi:predicted alpha-1,6-mannanase (GH76 family)